MPKAMFIRLGRCAPFFLLATIAAPASAQPSRTAGEEVVRLWPGQAPGTESWTGDETEKEDPANPFGTIRVKSNTTVPTLTVVRPPRGKANGTAMVILPGGAFQVLAWDIEGTEVARWLAERGITAFVLKYRVRARKLVPGEKIPTSIEGFLAALKPMRKIAIEDAAQAMRVIRRDRVHYGIRPDRVGMIGFSAGAITTVGLLLEGDPTARPNFAAPIYGTTLMDAPKVPADAPPIFIAVAQDDFLSAGSIEIYNLWTAAKRKAELHIYDKGGHGFGMRGKNLPLGSWPQALEAWMTSHGFLPAAAAPRRR